MEVVYGKIESTKKKKKHKRKACHPEGEGNETLKC